MDVLEFREAVLRLFREDPRFDPDAYLFVVQALALAQERLARSNVTARELLQAFRLHALRLHGPKAAAILCSWGVHSCQDIGEVVFLLVNRGLLQASPADRREEFAQGYVFADACGRAESLLFASEHLEIPGRHRLQRFERVSKDNEQACPAEGVSC